MPLLGRYGYHLLRLLQARLPVAAAPQGNGAAVARMLRKGLTAEELFNSRKCI